MLKHKESKEIPGGFQHVLLTEDDREVPMSDRTFDKRRILGVCVGTGCQVGCQMCFWHDQRNSRPLSSTEITDQVAFAMTSKEVGDENLIISLGKIGDPLSNAYNVASAISSWKWKYKEATIRISTPGTVRSPRFDKKLREAAESQDIDLRFSIHSTDYEERTLLVSNPNVIKFSEIAEFSNSWPNPPITLNMMMLKGFTYDARKIIEEFEPGKISVEIQPLIPNVHTKEIGLQDAPPLKALEFAMELRDNGFCPEFQME